MDGVKRAFIDLFRSPSRAGNPSVNTSEKARFTGINHGQWTAPDVRPGRVPHRPDKETDLRPLMPMPTHMEEPKAERQSINSAASLVWPPVGFAHNDVLSAQQAMSLISPGATIYRGVRVSIPHASDLYFALYAFCENEHTQSGEDVAPFFKAAFSAMTFRIQGEGLAMTPSDTLEQPSMAFCYGNRPGTITLNHWVSQSSRWKRTLDLRDVGTRPRNVELPVILERLIYLQGGFEEDYEELAYKNLYGTFLKDPDRYFGPHKAMEKQIADLIVVLSGPQWIDFSNPDNQTVGKYFSRRGQQDKAQFKGFCHQILLSTELYLRIHSKNHGDFPKQKLLSQLPPRVAWDLAIARKWRECITLERQSSQYGSIRICLAERKKQVKAIRKFARAIKWPNLTEIDIALGSKSIKRKPPEDLSPEAMSYFSGVLLPGASLQWLLMISLVDCDRGCRGQLKFLKHMIPHSGFQYRSSTYWSSACIVGKVLAPTCYEISGWVGPARPSPDLKPIQVARIRQRGAQQEISVKEVQSMSIRSDPLGPQAEVYPIEEYQLVLPDIEDIPNIVRIETLSLKAATVDPADEGSSPHPALFDACIRFAIGGQSWPLRLAFDVSYICASPCFKGPHPLFYDYIYKAVPVDEVLKITDWGGLAARRRRQDNMPKKKVSGEGDEEPKLEDDDLENVLVIEAFGVPDNEVLARAYASHWGLSAVIANVQKTCMACAIREAYAACLNVVILVGNTQFDINN